MINIEDFDFGDKKVLIRVDFNVPLNDQLHVTDDTRILAALPTIQRVLQDGGAAILLSHLGRPKNGPEDKFSLKHIVSTLSKHLHAQVAFASNCIGEEAERAVAALHGGEVLLLENLRFHPEEKAGNVEFAKKLASLGDVFVNDAFGTAHRAHASTSIIAQFFPKNKLFGFLMNEEVANLEKMMNRTEGPKTAIIGGAKVSSKISVITNMLGKVDNLIVGGGMAFTFIKAQGGEVGSSLVEDEELETAMEVLREAAKLGVNLQLPVDAVLADTFTADANTQLTPIKTIPEGWMGLDIGPDSVVKFVKTISESKTILWNGPMGVFELAPFAKGTEAIAQAVAAATKAGAYSLVGGGDSVAAINQCGLANQVSYVSTGGGAMLEYLEGKSLPGITAVLS